MFPSQATVNAKGVHSVLISNLLAPFEVRPQP